MDDGRILPARHRIDVDAYHALGEAGILPHDARVELIDGDIIDMAPIGQAHAGTTNRLTRLLVRACGDRAIVSVQNPVRLDRHSEPQPDFAILRPRPDFYVTGEPPGPQDTLLLIEVADTSLRYDRRVKRPLYARAGIPEYWIIDLKARILDAHRQPTADGYADDERHKPGDRIALTQDPEIVIPYDDIFG